jgi:FixJ family two-component response regulator
MDNATFVAIVDDDVSMRESLPDLVQKFGLSARAFASAEEFLASDCVCWTKCLILDFAMPGISGPDLQQELARRGQKTPIIFITGQRDQELRRQLLAGGAVECLFKPFIAAALLKALRTALEAG